MSCAAIPIASKFQEVLSDIILVTHCHSCGEKYAVTLHGYCGSHCSRVCWASNDLEAYDDEGACAHGGCKMCDTRNNLCKTRSMYHRLWDYSKVVAIPGWNSR
jgi:hypothetical protein